ncbi:MAG TPA: DNA helicase RecQ [Thermoanaerobaculia bacterium]|nr:DNA helicase RecQ [Thermoanaerobaculia bacterium]
MRERLLQVVEKHWGYSSFRPLQEEAMTCVLEGRDSVVVMPTGGGKSLCYQAPALLRDGVTVVVSPLISLMKDQVDALLACGVPATQMNSSQSPLELRALERDLHEGRIRLLFVSPERLALPGFRQSLRQAGVTAFAIDEAHCISHWGHDFRPEYRQLRALRETFPEAAFHAYTATATQQVRRDIVQQLALRQPAVLVGDFDRPNLTYRVLPRVDELNQLAEVLERHRGEAGIVYCIRRRDVDALSGQLRKRGYEALPYHAGMPQQERRATQEAFAAERCDVVVATVAFGMGIDRSNVRFVVHMAMPKSIEHYQQETGRAGRDGLEAECVLFYSGADVVLWKSMLARGGEEIEPDPRYLEAATRHLNDMDRYCSGTTCRHHALVGYFGQRYTAESCQACDVCLGEMEAVTDALTVAQKIVSCVYRLRQSFGVGHVISVLRGENIERVRERHHDQLTTYGIMRGHSRNEVRDLVYQLVSQGYLRQTSDEYPVLQLTEQSRGILRGEVEIRLRQPVVPKRKESRPRRAFAAGEDYDGDLFESLRKWRRAEAERRRVPPYVIFSDRTLREVARLQPTTLTALRGVYGIGDAKLEQFGEAVIRRVREHGSPAP